jgi:predicted Rdx family selenoprotein
MNGTPLEIRYCSSCSFFPMAAWIATEFWSEFNVKVDITLTPVGDARLEILFDGDVIFDRRTESNIFPPLPRIRQVKDTVRERLAAMPAGPQGH